MAKMQLVVAFGLFAFFGAGITAATLAVSDIIFSATETTEIGRYIAGGEVKDLEVLSASSPEAAVPAKLQKQLNPFDAKLATGDLGGKQRDG